MAANHAIVENFPALNGALTAPECFNTIWKLTRALKRAGAKYLASGNGTSKDTSGLPNSDLWGNAGATSNAGAASAATIASPTRGRATITGLTGITALDKGRFLVISGSGASNNGYHQIEEVLSSSSVRVDSRTVVLTAEASLTWSIVDPLLTAYPTALNTVAAWWTARLTSTIRIPITSAPVAGGGGINLTRGENIVQATTGFEGELLGYVFNVSSGYLVVMPRVRGTGGGVYGLTTGQAFTGSSSGATVTQDGTALEYRYEITVVKAANQTSGLVFITQAEPVGEGAANLFSQLATAAGCTATVPPGGGGTGNAFPSLAWVGLGTGTTVAAAVVWVGTSNSGFNPWGNAQIIVADMIEEAGYSADGSLWWNLCSNSTTIYSGGVAKPFGWQRCDDTEDGDLSPYVTINAGCLKTLYSNNRTSAGTIDSTANESLSTGGIRGATPVTSRVWCNGWVRRGLTNERFQEFEYELLSGLQTSAVPHIETNPGQSDTVATAPVITFVREPIWIGALATGLKARKGTLRWAFATGPGGNIGKLYDTDRWVQMSSLGGAFVIGPWNGATLQVVS